MHLVVAVVNSFTVLGGNGRPPAEIATVVICLKPPDPVLVSWAAEWAESCSGAFPCPQ